MKLGLSIPALMAALLVGFSSVDDVDARPALKRANPVTLPLKRIHTVRENLHPQIVSLALHLYIGIFSLRLTRLSHSFSSSTSIVVTNAWLA
jgi:ABC-type spermidine/putrescine transport system permease subunit II